jgi:hypothetical protein
VRKGNRRQCSGQIFVIAVLVVSLVLLSTQVYIYEIRNSLDETRSTRVNDFVLAVKLGSNNIISGSLANITRGGDSSVLSENLERWASFVDSFYLFGTPILNFTLKNTSPYVNGTYLFWGTEGLGISSACSDFNFSLVDGQVNVQLAYSVNVTTSIVVASVYRTLSGDLRQVNVTCSLLNQGKPALAKTVTVSYESSGFWNRADQQSNYVFTDYGNGTYFISFEADIPETNVNVSAQVYDSRGVYVQANATSTSTL